VKSLNFNNSAWDNKSYPLSLKNKILKQEHLIAFNSPFKKNIGRNFKSLSGKEIYFLGYDSSNLLHLGSLIPFLNLLNLLKDNKNTTNLLISINDIESGASRNVEWNKSKENILILKRTFSKLINKFNLINNSKVTLTFVIRSKETEIWRFFSKIIVIPKIEKIINKYYGNIPLKHLVSTLVMTSEFFRISQKNSIVTSYGYEELIHLNFINYLFHLDKKKEIKFITFLPITSPFNNKKKMSKSESFTSLFLQNNKSYLNEIEFRLFKLNKKEKEDLYYFWNFWASLLNENKTYSDRNIIKILKEFGS
jgi:hypothetical protein